MSENTTKEPISAKETMRQGRLQKLAELVDKGINPYPYTFDKNANASDLQEKYKDLQAGEETEDKYAKITGNFDLKDLGYDKIPENYYFVIGDNRNDSVDSRIIGLINIKDIEGSANLRLWPLNKIKYVK